MGKEEQPIHNIFILHSQCVELFLPEKLLKEKNIRAAGINRFKTNFEIERTNPGKHMLIYTVHGSGWVHTQGLHNFLKKNDVWIAPKGVPHHYGLKEEPWEIVWFHLEDFPPWNIIGENNPTIKQSFLVERIFHLTDSLLWESTLKDTVSIESSHLYMDLLNLYLEREMQVLRDPEIREVHHKFKMLFNIVRNNLTKNGH